MSLHLWTDAGKRELVTPHFLHLAGGASSGALIASIFDSITTRDPLEVADVVDGHAAARSLPDLVGVDVEHGRDLEAFLAEPRIVRQREAQVARAHDGHLEPTVEAENLPQVAAQGKHHLNVKKIQRDGMTLSAIEPLSQEMRVEEIARMLGGLELTETAHQHAREMLAI